MKLSKKFIAVPAIVVVAGISLTACSSGSSSTPSAPSAPAASSSSAPVSPLTAACEDWDQAKVASTTGAGQIDVQNAINVLGSTNTRLSADLSGAHAVAGVGGNVQWYIAQVNQICDSVVNGSSRSAS